MKIQDIQDQIVREVVSEEQIDKKLGEIAKLIEKDYEGKDLLLVGVLRGAVMCMADLSRHISRHLEMDWMAVSTYGHGTTSTGVVRILKDLDTDIENRNVLIVEDIDFLVFFNKKYVGLPPEVEKIDISVGSPELETEKSIGSSIKNEIFGLVTDFTCAF
jgi:hypothetical protein